VPKRLKPLPPADVGRSGAAPPTVAANDGVLEREGHLLKVSGRKVRNVRNVGNRAEGEVGEANVGNARRTERERGEATRPATVT
jgi:hypothetical protein